jgi:hypothetical protein
VLCGRSLPLRIDTAFWKAVLALAATFVFFGPHSSVKADFAFEVGLSGGYTDNLFLDSTDMLDRHVLNTLTVKYYPVSWIEASVYGELANYGELPSLSNRLGRVSITALPLGYESRASLTINGSFDGRRYHTDFSNYDNDNFNATVSFGYRLMPTLSARVGVLRQTSAYLASEEGDKESFDFFAGINATPFGRNSVDFEAGYGFADCLSIDTSKLFNGFLGNPDYPDSALGPATLRSYYFSPRYSRPIGEKTGLSITFVYRAFSEADDISVFAPSNELLSPWTSVWQGTSTAATVKTYLLKDFTISAGVGYWNKAFLSTGKLWRPGLKISRDDEQRKVFLQIIRPITAWRDATLQPRVRLDYTDNKSTSKLYRYSGFTIETGISLKF